MNNTMKITIAGLAITSAISIPGTIDAMSSSNISANTTHITKVNLNLREDMSTSSRILKTIPKGGKVTKISTKYGWAKVTYKGLTGYCHDLYLTSANTVSQNTNTSVLNTTRYVNTDVLHVRVQPNTVSKTYKRLYKGDSVLVLKQRNDGWSEVVINENIYYVSTQYLSDKKPNSSTKLLNNTDSKEFKYCYKATTPTKHSTLPSIHNVKVAMKAIDLKIVNPGETFYYLETLGSITKEKGYVESGVILNGVSSKGIGGGICQGSTTLHNAVIEAGLKVVERRNHSLPSKYVDKGLDAMVTGNLDYGFKNTSNYPIRIRAYVTDTEVVVCLESTGDITNGYKYIPKTEISADGLKAKTTIMKVKDGKETPHQTFYSSYKKA